MAVVATQKLVDYLALNQCEEDEDDHIDVEADLAAEGIRNKKFLKSLKGDIIMHTTAIIISQPFHVITIRIMSQFIGKENQYVYAVLLQFGFFFYYVVLGVFLVQLEKFINKMVF